MRTMWKIKNKMLRYLKQRIPSASLFNNVQGLRSQQSPPRHIFKQRKQLLVLSTSAKCIIPITFLFAVSFTIWAIFSCTDQNKEML